MNPFKEIARLKKSLASASKAQRKIIRGEIERINKILSSNPGLTILS